MKRRDVLKAGAVTGALVATGVTLSACASEDASESTSANESASEVAAAVAGSIALADIPVGGGVVIADPPVVVTQPAAGEVKAFTSICPHQGCKVSNVTNNEIFCACHGSKFSALDGSVIQGPAVEGLAAAAVSVDGTTVSFG
jgi:Rieske Fe-S protein